MEAFQAFLATLDNPEASAKFATVQAEVEYALYNRDRALKLCVKKAAMHDPAVLREDHPTSIRCMEAWNDAHTIAGIMLDAYKTHTKDKVKRMRIVQNAAHRIADCMDTLLDVIDAVVHLFLSNKYRMADIRSDLMQTIWNATVFSELVVDSCGPSVLAKQLQALVAKGGTVAPIVLNELAALVAAPDIVMYEGYLELRSAIASCADAIAEVSDGVITPAAKRKRASTPLAPRKAQCESIEV
jgi:hypothetical protein